jgi:hypothetical protein
MRLPKVASYLKSLASVEGENGVINNLRYAVLCAHRVSHHVERDGAHERLWWHVLHDNGAPRPPSFQILQGCWPIAPGHRRLLFTEIPRKKSRPKIARERALTRVTLRS